MAKKNVFISYRRDDAAGFAHAIYDRLTEHLPRTRVFMDVAKLEPGSDFVHNVKAAVSDCGVLIALIGRHWTGGRGDGTSRINDPNDWVRLEIATALSSGATVIPVLLEGASMPDADVLPMELKPLARMHATELRPIRANVDMNDLVGRAIVASGGKWPPDERGDGVYALLAALYAAIAGIAALFLMIGGLSSTPARTGSALGGAILAFNVLVLLRLPVHRSIRALSRHDALRGGALLHLLGVTVVSMAVSDWSGLFPAGILPAALLYLGANATKKLVRV
jgi:hypothetical protein